MKVYVLTEVSFYEDESEYMVRGIFDTWDKAKAEQIIQEEEVLKDGDTKTQTYWGIEEVELNERCAIYV